MRGGKSLLKIWNAIPKTPERKFGTRSQVIEKMARETGLEPATSGVTGRGFWRSISRLWFWNGAGMSFAIKGRHFWIWNGFACLFDPRGARLASRDGFCKGGKSKCSAAQLAHLSGGQGVVGSNPATPTILLFVSKGFILNGAAVSDASKVERKGVKSPAWGAKVPRNVPRLFAWRSWRGRVNLFWRLAAVCALLAVALASPAAAKGHRSGWARANGLSRRQSTAPKNAKPRRPRGRRGLNDSGVPDGCGAVH